jgi:hypothetical protein
LSRATSRAFREPPSTATRARAALASRSFSIKITSVFIAAPLNRSGVDAVIFPVAAEEADFHGPGYRRHAGPGKAIISGLGKSWKAADCRLAGKRI